MNGMEPSPNQLSPPRLALFVAPNFADDLRQLPSLFMTRRLLWLHWDCSWPAC